MLTLGEGSREDDSLRGVGSGVVVVEEIVLVVIACGLRVGERRAVCCGLSALPEEPGREREEGFVSVMLGLRGSYKQQSCPPTHDCTCMRSSPQYRSAIRGCLAIAANSLVLDLRYEVSQICFSRRLQQ